MDIGERTRLSSKILTYYFNAFVDAQMAEELLVFLKSGRKKYATKNTEAQKRAQAYVNSLKPSDAEIVSLAYTLYYANGLANYLYARDLSRLIRQEKNGIKLVKKYRKKLKKTLNTKHQFAEFDQMSLATYVWKMLFNRFGWLDDFLEQRKIEIRPDQQMLRRFAAIVQHKNSEFNHGVADTLLSKKESELDKIKLLREAAEESKRPKRFLKSAARTQRSASRWDKLYRFMLGRVGFDTI